MNGTNGHPAIKWTSPTNTLKANISNDFVDDDKDPDIIPNLHYGKLLYLIIDFSFSNIKLTLKYFPSITVTSSITTTTTTSKQDEISYKSFQQPDVRDIIIFVVVHSLTFLKSMSVDIFN